jgi:hypothetical protein
MAESSAKIVSARSTTSGVVLLALLLAACAMRAPLEPPLLACNVVLPGTNARLEGRGGADDGHPIPTGPAAYGPTTTPPFEAIEGPNGIDPAPHRAFARSILTNFDTLSVRITGRTHPQAARIGFTAAESKATSELTLEIPLRCRLQIASEAPLVLIQGGLSGYTAKAQVRVKGGAEVARLVVRYDFVLLAPPINRVLVFKDLSPLATNSTIPNNSRHPVAPNTTVVETSPPGGFVLRENVTYEIEFTVAGYGAAINRQPNNEPPRLEVKLDATAKVALVP